MRHRRGALGRAWRERCTRLQERIGVGGSRSNNARSNSSRALGGEETVLDSKSIPHRVAVAGCL
jgi:hypothetical protein